MLRTLKVVTALTILGAYAAPAFAQDETTTSPAETDDSGRSVKYKARTEIDFEGVDVNGELVKPQGQLLLDRRKAKFNPLIQMRDNWDIEMKESVDEVK